MVGLCHTILQISHFASAVMTIAKQDNLHVSFQKLKKQQWIKFVQVNSLTFVHLIEIIQSIH